MAREYVCKNCGHIGYPERVISHGSGFIALILWSLYALPGLIYSICSHKSNKRCANCYSNSLVTLNSAYGKMISEEFYEKKISEISNKNKL